MGLTNQGGLRKIFNKSGISFKCPKSFSVTKAPPIGMDK